MDDSLIAQHDIEGVLASLSPELLDRLADLIVAKLPAKNAADLFPKQNAVGSNFITRSKELCNDLPGSKR